MLSVGLVTSECRPFEARARYEELTKLAGEARRRGDSDGYARLLLEAAGAAEVAELPNEVTRMWRAAAHTHLYARRFGEVEPLLDRAEALDLRHQNHSGLVRAAHYRGVLLTELGRYREARQVLAAGIARAEEHQLHADRAVLRRSMAVLLQDLGRHTEALRMFAEVESDAREQALPQAGIEHIVFLFDYAWAELRAIEAGVAIGFEAPRARLEEALSLARSAGAPLEEANAMINLAWLAHLSRDDQACEALLSALPNVETSFGRLDVQYLRAHLELRRQRFYEAEVAFAELRRLALSESSASSYLWRATYGLGRALLGQGAPALAQVQLIAAIGELDQLAEETDLLRSRGLFVQDRRSLFDDAAELALVQGRIFDALAIVERARSYVFRSLRAQALDPARIADHLQLREKLGERRRQADLIAPENRAAFDRETARLRVLLSASFEASYGETSSEWITEAALAEALEDAALISFAERSGAFVATGSSITHHANAGDLRAIWPAGARHVYVVPGGAIGPREVLSALARAPELLERSTISFLPHAALLFAERSTPAGGAPLIAGDPDGTLPAARKEASWVAAHLGARTFSGSRSRLLEELRGASVFHFAGHGILEPSEPWNAHLVLARGETLTLEDLLISRPSAGVVVLSGCRTGAPLALSTIESIGLPHAFLIAGARAVLATTEDLEDQAALPFIQRFYEAGGATNPIDAWPEAARESQRAGDPIWSRFYISGRSS